MSLSKYEKDLFEGFLYRFLLNKENSFYFPIEKGIQTFLNAKKEFSNELKSFSKRAGDGRCLILEALINHSISIGNLEANSNPVEGHYNIWKSSGPDFKISPKLYSNNSAEDNYEKNKEVINKLFESYKSL